jgi:hypothetical protein
MIHRVLPSPAGERGGDKGFFIFPKTLFLPLTNQHSGGHDSFVPPTLNLKL